MKSIPSALLTHLAQEVTTLAVCWRVTRRDGVLILGTEHDQPIVVGTNSTALDLTGTYEAQAGITGSDVSSTSDMAVDNMEVRGAINMGDLTLVDLSAADIEAGLFDGASVTLFSVNWAAPNDGQIVHRTGVIGEINRSTDGEYKTELRGLTQYLSQKVVRSYGASCDAEFGDFRCGVDIEAFAILATVAVVTSNRVFTVTLTSAMPGGATPAYFNGGLLRWGTGDNATYTMEARRVSEGALVGDLDVELFLPMSQDVQVGDTLALIAGCDKTPAMCKTRFNNLVNFRGHGAWVPGVGEALVFGGQTTERRPRNPSFFTIVEQEEP